jgi:CRP-like cAMP-binding protein
MATIREDVLPTLESSPLFRGLSRKQLHDVVDRFDDAQYLAGHGILTEGMQGPEFFIILEGSASVSMDGKHLATLGPGGFFGEVAALDGGPRTASVKADTRLRCLTLPVGGLRQFLLDYPLVAVNLLPEIVRRFRSAQTGK